MLTKLYTFLLIMFTAQTFLLSFFQINLPTYNVLFFPFFPINQIKKKKGFTIGLLSRRFVLF